MSNIKIMIMEMKDKVLMMIVLIVAVVGFNVPLFFMTDPLNRQSMYVADFLFLMPLTVAYIGFIKFN